MKTGKLWLFTVSLLLVLTFGAQAQKKTQKQTKKPAQKTEVKKPVKKPVQKSAEQKPVRKPDAQKPAAEKVQPDAAQNEKKVKDIVTFLQYVLNMLGSSTTSTRDKEVLVTESYTKIFRDGKVQVEDDLDEEREVITNKDIVAYLKDVDFFFTDAKFEFTIDGIQESVNTNGVLFYKVSLRRNLVGTTAEGKPVNKTIPRYVEINYNPDDQDLKIVSIYTNEINEKEALTNWWKDLSFEWQSLFKKNLNITADSLTLTDIRNVSAIEALDLHGNTYIVDLVPLARLTNLKSLDVSRTAIADLTSIRNLTELVELNLSHTKVLDLSALKYSSKLTRLDISHTEIRDISVLQKMPGLQYLDVSSSRVTDFSAVVNLGELIYLNLKDTAIPDLSVLQNLAHLTELNISGTRISDINPMKGLKNLKTLYLDSTRTSDITALGNLESLQVLHANYTAISDLRPLQTLPHLEKVYVDQTQVKRETADAFMAGNSKVLVVYNSFDLKAWWEGLPVEWQQVLRNSTHIGQVPTKEELANVTNLDSISFSGSSSIRDLEPLSKLPKLRVIIASKTSVYDLTPLQHHNAIVHLDISETAIADLSVVSQFTQLKILRADKSKIENLAPLYGITTLEKVYADQTSVQDYIAQEFLKQRPKCLLIYKTIHVKRWWGNLSANWKEVFRAQMAPDTVTTRENLHKLAERQSLHIKDVQVNDLSALSEFVFLRELRFSGTAITEIPALENLRSLVSLHATNSPLQKIESLTAIPDLEGLDISNTPLDELKVIGSLKNLKSLNCSGTQIKKLSSLEGLSKLELLDCSNTRVNSLDPVMNLPLKTLKCYNTKVSEKEVANFKKSNPDCNVVFYR